MVCVVGTLLISCENDVQGSAYRHRLYDNDSVLIGRTAKVPKGDWGSHPVDERCADCSEGDLGGRAQGRNCSVVSECL